MDNNNPINPVNPVPDDESNKKYQEILDKYASDLGNNTSSEPNISPPSPSTELPETDNNPTVAFQEIVNEAPQVTTSLEELSPPPSPFQITSPKEDLSQASIAPPLSPPTEPVLPPPPSIVLPPVASQPSQPVVFKFLFYLSLFVFILVLSGLGWTIVKLNNLKNTQSTSTPTTAPSNLLDPSPTAIIGPGCDLNDKRYSIGETFPAADGCNTCSCGSSLTIDCTLIGCESNPIPSTSTTSAAPKDIKTYSSKLGGYQFTYSTKQYKLSTSANTVKLVDLAKTDNTHGYGNISVLLHPKISIDEYIPQIYKPKIINTEELTTFKEIDLLVNGTSAKKVSYISAIGDTYESILFYSAANVIEISTNGPVDSVWLSTFKLTK